MDDEFEVMDREAGVQVMESVSLPSVGGSNLPAKNSVLELRDSLVREYHEGSESLVDRLGSDIGADDLLKALIKEVIGETDSLLGNRLVAASNGDLRDASVISYKRAETIEKVIKALNAQRLMEKESGIDIESPSMSIIFQFFMEKVNESFVKMQVDSELKDVFFGTLGEETKNWKKELKARFKELKSGR